ncbi:hypothetical protein HPB49_008464 [Dermacentor silvarum]|uniref:Uncharacterized protein n=1 Tax=Dermacentor silvarum TaxID=543639 RepID=A0ACB8CK16_DERSI|nr:hypothetical protein HPB49_008464 [Dermacentor silvarum]
MAGRGDCKHCAALAIFVVRYEDRSSTTGPKCWGVPSKKPRIDDKMSIEDLFGGSAQIGSKCVFLSCRFARHAACDANNVCRCKPDYPVQVSPLRCAKARRHLEVCTDNRECTEIDKNTYCSRTSSQSRCECHDDFVYNEETRSCELMKLPPVSPDILLPMAVGVSVALSSMLCCFLALWRLCKRANSSGFLSSLQSSGSANLRAAREHAPVRTQDSWSSDTLPSYEAAVSLKRPSSSQEDPPPPYCEAVTLQLPLSETKV